MEEFKNIDWTPDIEDVVDEKFVDEDRLRKESAMYKILSCTFDDPFQDIRPPVFNTNQGKKKKMQEKPAKAPKKKKPGRRKKIDK